MSTHRAPQRLDLMAASDVVGLPPVALEALADAAFMASTRTAAGPRFETADLKAFVARNADNGAGSSWLPRSLTPELDPLELVSRLEARAEHMALRLFKMYTTVHPKAVWWPPERQNKFVQQTRSRFEVMLAVAARGDRLPPAFFDDLNAIGGSAARVGVRLPQLLTILRVSRDLVVQNAVELAFAEPNGGAALSLVLTRILPAMDRIGDALTAGYWEAMFPG